MTIGLGGLSLLGAGAGSAAEFMLSHNNSDPKAIAYVGRGKGSIYVADQGGALYRYTTGGVPLPGLRIASPYRPDANSNTHGTIVGMTELDGRLGVLWGRPYPHPDRPGRVRNEATMMLYDMDAGGAVSALDIVTAPLFTNNPAANGLNTIKAAWPCFDDRLLIIRGFGVWFYSKGAGQTWEQALAARPTITLALSDGGPTTTTLNLAGVFGIGPGAVSHEQAGQQGERYDMSGIVVRGVAGLHLFRHRINPANTLFVIDRSTLAADVTAAIATATIDNTGDPATRRTWLLAADRVRMFVY